MFLIAVAIANLFRQARRNPLFDSGMVRSRRRRPANKWRLRRSPHAQYASTGKPLRAPPPSQSGLPRA